MFIRHPRGEIFAVGRVDHQSRVFIIDDDDPYVPLTPPSSAGSNGFVNILMIPPTPTSFQQVDHSVPDLTLLDEYLPGISNLFVESILVDLGEILEGFSLLF